jgi:iron-sulfur cluster assembly protein
MTLTTPHCPVAESMPGEVELRVLSVPGIRDAEVKLVWDPPWDPSKMSDEARSNWECYERRNETPRASRRDHADPRRRSAHRRADGRAPEGAIGVKLSTPRRGCSGLAYSVDYVTEEQPFDEKIETPGGAFYVDGAGPLPDRLDMDWREDDFAAGFTFDNPNAKGACGCGESFTVYWRNGEYGRAAQAEYCTDRAFLAALDRMSARAEREQANYPMEQRIRYILTTGGNWRSPIGDFRMVVDKGRAENLVSFCGQGVRGISPTQFEVRHRNWRPDRDLAVLIVTTIPE